MSRAEIKRSVRKVYMGLRLVYVWAWFEGLWLAPALHRAYIGATRAWWSFIGGESRGVDAVCVRFFHGVL